MTDMPHATEVSAESAAAIRKWLPSHPRLRGKMTRLTFALDGQNCDCAYDTEWNGNLCRRKRVSSTLDIQNISR